MRLPVAQSTVAEFTGQLEQLYYADPDLRLVGSLGRAAWFDGVFDDPLAEYRARGEHPLYNLLGKPRDIDIIGEVSSGTDGPHPLDLTCFHNSSIAVQRTDEGWVVRSEDRDFEEPLDPAVMEPVEGKTIYGVPCKTLPWQTHVALCEAMGVPRRKDDLAMRTLREAGRASGQTLPEELYSPFTRLLQIQENPARRLLQLVYRRYLPASLVMGLRPYLMRFNPASAKHVSAESGTS